MFDVRLKADMAAVRRQADGAGLRAELHDDVLRVRIPAGQSPQMLWEVAAEQNEQIRYLAAAAQHARRSVLESRGANLMPIFDQGYQHWSGHLSGHAWRWLAIARHGVRDRHEEPDRCGCASMLAWLPAIVLAFVLCIWGLVEQKSALVESIMPF